MAVNQMTDKPMPKNEAETAKRAMMMDMIRL
jgi:hypothetical protein